MTNLTTDAAAAPKQEQEAEPEGFFMPSSLHRAATFLVDPQRRSRSNLAFSGEGGEEALSCATAAEDLVARLRSEKAQAEAEAARARAELKAAWEEMRDAWELREEEERWLRRLMARMEERNADLELRDRELRGDLSRLAHAEAAHTRIRLLHKLVYQAYRKGFLPSGESSTNLAIGSSSSSSYSSSCGDAVAAAGHDDEASSKQQQRAEDQASWRSANNEIEAFIKQKLRERESVRPLQPPPSALAVNSTAPTTTTTTTTTTTWTTAPSLAQQPKHQTKSIADQTSQLSAAAKKPELGGQQEQANAKDRPVTLKDLFLPEKPVANATGNSMSAPFRPMNGRSHATGAGLSSQNSSDSVNQGSLAKRTSRIERDIEKYCGNGLCFDKAQEERKVPVAVQRLVLKMKEESFFVLPADPSCAKSSNAFLVDIVKAIGYCVKMCKRDPKAQAFWLSYTTSFLHLLKKETKGRWEGMREIRDPQKHGVQVASIGALVLKITRMPGTSAKNFLLSRQRIELCGLACKLLQIAQRIYSNLLKIIAGQLNPLLIAVVFYPPAIPSAPGLRPTTSSIAAPTTSTMRAHVRDYSCVRDVYGILRALSLMFHNLESNNVYHSVIEQIFTQTFHMIDAALFNHLIDNARQLATVSHALVAKSVLSQLILWRRRVNLVHLNHKQLGHIREALNMLSMSKAILLEVDTVQAFPHLNDLQILHLLVFFRPSDLAPEPVPGKVKQKLQERIQKNSQGQSLRIDPTLMLSYTPKKRC